MISFSFDGTDIQVVRSIDTKNLAIKTALKDKMFMLMQRLERKIIDEKLSGQLLERVSGRLAMSIQVQDVTQKGNWIIGGVEQNPAVAPYGPVLEAGGTGPYKIIAHKKALMFLMEGIRDPKALIDGLGFTPYVRREPFPGKHFMSSSLQEMRQEIIDGLKQAIIDASKPDWAGY